MMKKIVSAMCAAALAVTLAGGALAAATDYTLEEKLEKQVVSSGLRGTVSFAADGDGFLGIDDAAWLLVREILPQATVDVTSTVVSDSRPDRETQLTINRNGAAAGQADILQDPPHFPCGKFDLVVSNPPYVLESQKVDMRPNVLDHEPEFALFVTDDDPLVFYRAVARWSRELLSPEGIGIVEINDLLGLQTRDVFLDAGFRNAGIINDFSGKNRFVKFSR